MPELPEVENLARGLTARILGATIMDIRCHFPAVVRPDADCFADAIRGRTIDKLRRHGKYLFFLLDGDVAFALHLRMTGQLLLVPGDQRVDRHTHLEILLADRKSKIVYRDVRKFGRLELLNSGVEQFVQVKKLGIDALSISAGHLFELFQKTSRTIKAALLDQRVIAGLGNIYTDEILFREGISPLRKAASLKLEQVASLRLTIRAVLRSAVRRKGTTISDYVDDQGQEGSFQKALLVYSRAGEPCRRCGTPIIKQQVAGRGTYSCPLCQRA
ncbi:MAG: bifunctional DNA-formamidopyrimidine glycosylase/DNA-(apurinic or apyrimidinic site) lyase [Spirochaetaceae bacterium]|nr:MAG: bifunctional DNA-formamidopyrimidine glycosylase/DNA-(apurinic or apyrimidinic site) lyase [Spirochaetaceae bacterium]